VRHVAISIYDDADNPHYGGGGATVVHQVATRLAKDYRVTVYCGSYRGSGRTRTRDGVRYVFLPVGWAGPRGGQLLFQLILPFVALLAGADLWIESFTPPFSVSLLPLICRVPVIGLVQMLAGSDMQRKYRLPFTVVERRGLRLYRHFVVLNEPDRAAVLRYSPGATCDLIPNGVLRMPVADRAFGSGDYALFLGRIDVEQKGLDLLLAAVAADPGGPPLVIAGAGTPAEERKLRALVAPLGERVRLAGRVCGAAKDELLRGCAFVVMPSRFETFSLTALEAMAYGKPVVCFDLPQLGWIPSQASIRVLPYDVTALTAALGDLALDRARRAELGRSAHETSRDYDWDVIGDRYRSLLTAVLAARP
jgi:phosphatidylinositol alpha-mannosyltransferase